MSGLVERIPAKNATPSATIKRIDKNRFMLRPISTIKSLRFAFFIQVPSALDPSVHSSSLFQQSVPASLTRVFLYHSIFSTESGLSFSTILPVFPFFICITLSAIGASAELWVITITVIFFSLQVS